MKRFIFALVMLLASCADAPEDGAPELDEVDQEVSTWAVPASLWVKMVVLSYTPIPWVTGSWGWAKGNSPDVYTVNYNYSAQQYPTGQGLSSANSCTSNSAYFVCDGVAIYCPFVDHHIVQQAYYLAGNGVVTAGWYPWVNNSLFLSLIHISEPTRPY